MSESDWEQGVRAAEAFSWEEAVRLLGSTLDRDAAPRPEHLEALANAAWWLSDIDTAIRARELAFASLVASGDEQRAGQTALDLAEHYAHKSKSAVSRAWLGRADEIAARLSDPALSGQVERVHARRLLDIEGDPHGALEHIDEALAYAAQSADHELEMLATHDRGQVLVALGRLSEGTREMERAMVAAATGALSPLTTGKVYCNMIAASLNVGDFGTAAEWSEEAERWCDGMANASGYPGICRVRRSEVNRRRGLLDAAVVGAEKAAGELQHFVPLAAAAIVEIGHVHLLRGDLESAEREFLRAHAMGHEPMPGMAQLRLAQGRADAAAALIRVALEAKSNAPLDRLKLLPAAVEIFVAQGDVEGASARAAELLEIAEQYPTAALVASAAFADGLVRAAEGDHGGAVGAFRVARSRWAEAGLPCDAARARAALGRSLVLSGGAEAGELEMAVARADFERLGIRLGVPTDGVGAQPSDDRAARALSLIDGLERLVVGDYSVVGRYTRFSPAVRNTLADVRQRIVAGLMGTGGQRENHMLWASPGSGKTFFAEEIARSLEGVAFGELNLARLDEPGLRSGLDEALAIDGPVLVLLDEIDARPDETWQYGLLLPYLDSNAKREAPVVFVMAGSGGSTIDDFVGSIRARPKGSDLLSRIPQSNMTEVAGLEIGDQVLVAISHFVRSAEKAGRSVGAVERAALYYLAVTEYLMNARQLSEFAARAVTRMPPGEERVKFDHLFGAGDPENKAFWRRIEAEAASLMGDFVVVAA